MQPLLRKSKNGRIPQPRDNKTKPLQMVNGTTPLALAQRTLHQRPNRYPRKVYPPAKSMSSTTKSPRLMTTRRQRDKGRARKCRREVESLYSANLKLKVRLRLKVSLRLPRSRNMSSGLRWDRSGDAPLYIQNLETKLRDFNEQDLPNKPPFFIYTPASRVYSLNYRRFSFRVSSAVKNPTLA